MPEEELYYEDRPGNFNHRLKVQTNMGSEGIVDHREGFSQREYHRGTPGVYETPDGAALGDIQRGERSKVAPPKPQPKRRKKTETDDAALEAANKKDLKSRNLKS